MVADSSRQKLDRAWATVSPLLPHAIGTFLLSFVISSLVLTRSVKLGDGIFVVTFAALVVVVAVLENIEKVRSTAGRRAVMAGAVLLGLLPAVVHLLTS